MKRRAPSVTVKLSSHWLEFLQLLTRHRVRFIIVGAHALADLGRPRYTGDLDVFVEPSAINAKRVSAALRDFGFDGAAEAAHQFSSPGKMMTLGVEPHRIDITTDMTALTFAEAWRNRRRRNIEGAVVYFLGRDAYIKNKLATAAHMPLRRAKDLHDVEMLETLQSRKKQRKKFRR